jgi:predicted dehydrogenase
MPTSTSWPVRVGVIGTGFGTSVHVPAFKAAEDFEVVAIVSRRCDKAERVAQEHGIGWASDDYRACCARSTSTWSAPPHPGLHHEMVLAAANAVTTSSE